MSTFARQTCPSCGREGRVRAENLGRAVRCKRCGATIGRSAEAGPVPGAAVAPADLVRSLRLAEQRERIAKDRLAEVGEQLVRARRDLAALAERVERLTRERDDARVEAALARGDLDRPRSNAPAEADRLHAV